MTMARRFGPRMTEQMTIRPPRLSIWQDTKPVRVGSGIGAVVFTLAGGVWATGALLSNPDVPAWTSSLIALPVALLCWTAFQQLRLVSRMPTARRSSEQTAE